MTPKQILDSFSETLMRDERILSAQERALLATLLQHAGNAVGQNLETREAVRAVIASAVGETVAQRAFAVLGSSIVERILQGSPLATNLVGADMAQTQPQPPKSAPMGDPLAPSPSPDQPQPPRAPFPGKAPHHKPPKPHGPMRDTPVDPSVQPQPPKASLDREVVAAGSVAVLEKPSRLPAHCVVLDEFLAPQEMEELIRFALQHEADFAASEIVSPVMDGGGVVNYEHRRSRVLMDLGPCQELIVERIKAVLPQVLGKLGMEEFAISRIEAQITASNDEDFFRSHSDNGSDPVASRHLTFVYFFQREPKQFTGGELRIHDARLEGDNYVSEGSYQEIVPRQNQIIFFPCELLHEITPVTCPSRLFADSRFTLNGWLRQ
jgi:Rps23 Pro-64 3,4-dihydroxylase Tpa1-like proline 4-hydroxylase